MFLNHFLVLIVICIKLEIKTLKILAIIRALFLALSMALFLIVYAIGRLVFKHTPKSSFRLRRNWLSSMGLPGFGIKVQVKGKPIKEPAIYVCNHRSFSDPIVLCKYLDAYGCFF